jgi:hypothetical protein
MGYDGRYWVQLSSLSPEGRGGAKGDEDHRGRTAMLVSKLSCPKCKTVLRPAKPLPAGKMVKCPKCANDFTAEEGNVEQQTAAPPKAKSVAPKKPAAKPAAKLAPKSTNAKTAPAKLIDDDDDDDGGGTYAIHQADRPKTQEDLDREEEEGDDDDDKEDKISFVPDHSIKDLRGPAQIAVIRPSNMLILNGVIGFFGWAILFIILILPVVFPVLEDEADKVVPVPAKGGKAEKKKVSLIAVGSADLTELAKLKWYYFALSLAPIFLGIAYACVMTYGAVQMQNLESRVWGFVANGMCIFPFATWGFVVVCSIVITLVVYGMTDDMAATWGSVIAFASLEALGCIGIGIYGIVTLLRQDVIDGFNYVPDD